VAGEPVIHAHPDKGAFLNKSVMLIMVDRLETAFGRWTLV
jgi:hypothetical protein